MVDTGKDAPMDTLSSAAPTAPPLDEAATAARVEDALETVARIRAGVAAAVIGQERVVDLTLAAVLAGGHALLVGAPGLAKTTLVEAVAVALGLDWGRVQFTPDLMPADIIGVEVLETGADGTRTFRFQKGPVFTRLLMADEINRASPRTQSALLQAMQEGHVTVSGQRHDLPAPFHVLATQNPIEQEGTYPLPEAQLDRFLLQIDVPWPDRETERKVLLATTGRSTLAPVAACTLERLGELQALVRDMPVGERVLDAALDLVRAARPDGATREDVKAHVSWGPGPRAGQALVRAAKARALLRGRVSPTLDDLAAVARPALVHRMALSWRARADGIDLGALVDSLALETFARA
jgi:MoxR-like ATPase